MDNWRWAGVPFYIRTGKRLPKRITEVVLQFQRPPHPADPARPSYRALAGRADPADPAGPLPAAGELRRWQRAACRVGTAGLRAMLGGAAPEPLDVLVGVPTDTENASRSPCSATCSAPESSAGRIRVLLVRPGPIRLLEDAAGCPKPADPLTLDGPGAVRRKSDPVVGVGLVDDARLIGPGGWC